MQQNHTPKFQDYNKNRCNLEVRKGVHRKLTNFNQNNMNLLYTILYEQRENLAHC